MKGSATTVRSWARGRAGAALIVLVLAGCATPRPALSPGELPLHTPDPRGFTLHWRLDQTAEAVVAEGVVESTRLDRFSQITLELAGVDAQGSVVAHSRTTALPRDFTGATPWPFTIRVRPAGGEARFLLSVTDALPKVSPGR